MAGWDNGYSRFIALARILLPLAALGLLSTLFLISRGPGTGDDLPYARVDIEELAREQRVGAPSFASVTRDGAALAIEADTARPDLATPGRASADTMRARLDMPDGSHAEIAAARGTIDTGAETATLEGGTAIDTSTGYHIRTDSLRSSLVETDVVARSPVTADGPPGRIEAGALHLTTRPGDGARYVLVFKDGVKLVYDPKQQGPAQPGPE